VTEYPLTPSGKIQKNVLQDWISERKLEPVN
jgi:acyl-coenzyme A synthetase/AMP-(fatty) acid ligase